MKKTFQNLEHYIQIAFLVLVFGVLPTITYGAVLANLEAERGSLISQISFLQSEANAQKAVLLALGATTTATSSPVRPATTTPPVVATTTLKPMISNVVLDNTQYQTGSRVSVKWDMKDISVSETVNIQIDEYKGSARVYVASTTVPVAFRKADFYIPTGFNPANSPYVVRVTLNRDSKIYARSERFEIYRSYATVSVVNTNLSVTSGRVGTSTVATTSPIMGKFFNADFNVKIRAESNDISFGAPASAFDFDVTRNNIPIDTSRGSVPIVSYGTVNTNGLRNFVPGTSGSFTVLRGNEVIIPIRYIWNVANSYLNSNPGYYAVELDTVNFGLSPRTTGETIDDRFWTRTSSVTLP